MKATNHLLCSKQVEALEVLGRVVCTSLLVLQDMAMVDRTEFDLFEAGPGPSWGTP